MSNSAIDMHSLVNTCEKNDVKTKQSKTKNTHEKQKEVECENC